MKLYATIKNEKLKLAKLGGNESITFEINKGNRRMVEFYATIENIEDTELLVIYMLDLQDGTTKQVFSYEFITKGEKQKGEILCANCDDFGRGEYPQPDCTICNQ